MSQSVPRRAVALTAALALTAAGLIVMVPPPVGQAVPGFAGTPQPPASAYLEDFQSGASAPVAPNNTTVPIGNFSYTDVSTGATAYYSADAAWTAGSGGTPNCNGWVLNFSSAVPADAACTANGGATGAAAPNNTQTAWWFLQRMAVILAVMNGDTTTALENNVVASQTNGGSQIAGYQFIAPNVVMTVPGHFYAVAADFVEAHCPNQPGGNSNWFPASETLVMVVDGVDQNVVGDGTLAGGISPCTGQTYTRNPPSTQWQGLTPTAGQYGVANWYATSFATLHLVSGPVEATTAVPLGLKVFNAQPQSTGNDVAFDNLQILDVTPQLDKSFSPASIPAGGSSTLTWTITNTDELNAKPGWSFTDNLPANLTAVAGTEQTDCANGVVTPSEDGTSVYVAGDLAAGDPGYCTASVTVTSDTVGSYTNDGSNIDSPWGINPPDPSGGDGSGTVDVVSNPALTLTKTAATGYLAADGTTPLITAAGQTIAYTIAITNSGDVPISNLALDDSDFSGTGTLPTASCTPVALGGTLAAGATTTCTATYTVTQTDLDAGVAIDNSAKASGLGLGQTDPTDSNTDTATVDVQPASSLTLLKSVKSVTDDAGQPVTDGTGSPIITAVGQTVTYEFDVGNTGTTTISDIWINDDGADYTSLTSPGFSGDPDALSDIVCDATTLAPGETTTCTATYTTNQDDLDFGVVINQAQALGTPPGGTPDSVKSNISGVTVRDEQAAKLQLDKTHEQLDTTKAPVAGDVVTFVYTVTNNGNVTVTDIGVTDTMPGLSLPISCDATSLAPEESTTCSATYTLTQTDINTGSVENPMAQATGTQTDGDTGDTSTVVSNPASDTVPLPADPSITLLKTATVVDAGGQPVTNDAGQPAITAAGQTVTYSFLVTNTGNVTLSGITISDPSPWTDADTPGFSGTGPAWIPPTCALSSLAGGTSETCTETYVTTQDDIDAGWLGNTATVTGAPPTGSAVTSDPSNVMLTAAPDPSLTVVKSATPSTVTTLGQSVSYSFLVTNTGNVTLHGITVDEASFTGTGTAPVISCPTTPVLPGGTTTCTASYTVTQADLDAGSIDNSATATGTDPNDDDTTSTPSEFTVDVSQTPALALVKDTDPTDVQITSAGEEIDYTFTVTNTGNVTVTDLTVSDDDFSGTGTLSEVTCPVTYLVPGDSAVCRATYTTTLDDVDAASVTNHATAHGTDPKDQPVDSFQMTKIVPSAHAPALTLVKSADPSDVLPAVGEPITFYYDVTNTGNVTVTGLWIAEGTFTGSGTLPTPTCPVDTLDPGDSTRCETTYTVTQDDVDAGVISNTATANGFDTNNFPLASPPDSVTVPSDQTPAISLSKTADPDDVLPAVGETITYTLVATNTGGVTLHDVAITEDDFSGAGTAPTLDCPGPTTLAPGDTTTCTATYAIVQDDVDAGFITNSASVTGQPPTGSPVTDTAETQVPSDSNPELTLDKTASPDSGVVAGDTVTYSFAVTNSGDVTIKNLAINETSFDGTGTLGSITCLPFGLGGTLAPSATTTCKADYEVTQADVDAGSITNTATASGKDPSGAAVTSDESSAEVDADQTPKLTLLKESSSTPSVAGDEVDYTFTVTNSGTTTVTSIAIVENAFSGTGTKPTASCPKTTLAPGEDTVCTASYTVTQDDVDAGTLDNTATATGTSLGNPVTSHDSTVELPITPAPELTLDKTANPTTVATAGEWVQYSLVVTNTGNVTLSHLAVSEDDFTGSDPLDPVTCSPVDIGESLAVDASTTCTVAYQVTQDDIDAGGPIDNTATAHGTAPGASTTTDSEPSSAEVTVTQTPELTLVKSVAPSGELVVGRTVTYSYAVTNTGNVSVTDLAINDGDTYVDDQTPGFSGSGALSAITCPVTDLAPGDSTTCTATYTITQDDVDAGHVYNTATAEATDPSSNTVTSEPSTATLPGDPEPAVSLTKAHQSVTPPSAAGQAVTFVFTVLNSGNVTLDGSTLSIADTMTGIQPASCSGWPNDPELTLEPGDSVTCTASYTLTQADIDAGKAVNPQAVATITPLHSTTPVSSDPATDTVPLQGKSELGLVKTSTSTPTQAGDPITYSFQVTNTGTTTISGLSVAEVSFSGTGTPPVASCPLTTLKPTESTTCTATYTVTQADVDAGGVTNKAQAHGVDLSGNVDSNQSTATVPIEPSPSLTLDKTASVSEVTAAGQIIRYSFAVANTGNVSLSSLAINETDFTGSGTIGAVTCTPVALGATLAPGATTTCTAAYTVTQADIDAGGPITNTATAQGTPPGSSTPEPSDPSTATVDVTQTPALSLTKSVTPSGDLVLGQTVTYSFAVTNSGNVTISNLTIDDGSAYADKTTPGFSGSGSLSAIDCPVTELAPGESTTCTATYVITQDDVDAGDVLNTATASGDDPGDQPVTSNPSYASIPAEQEPAVSLTKSHVDAAVPAAAGDVVTFLFTVSNSGTVTLDGDSLSFTDSLTSAGMSAVTCPATGEAWPNDPATTLAPGESVVCSATYTLTQTDVDAGQVVNQQAVVTATELGTTTTVDSSPASDTLPLTGEAALTLDKSTLSTPTKAGDTISYSFAVDNTGTLTVTNLAVSETTFSGTGGAPLASCPVTSLAPGEQTTCTATYTVTQADVDAGVIDNTAVAAGVASGQPVDSADSSAEVVIDPTPSLSLTKSVAPSNSLALGQAVTYSFKVTNTGNVTITDLAIDDGSAYVDTTTPGFSGSGSLSTITCPVTTLAPGASTTCSATYIITQDDVDAGNVFNTATATGNDPDSQPVTSDPSDAKVPEDQTPAVSLVKSHVDATVPAAAGDVVTFLFTVSNSGTVTLDGDSLSFADSLSGLSAVTCPASGEAWPNDPATTLAPGDSVVCSATYTLTQTDVDAGQVVNQQAVVTATELGTTTTVDSDPATDTVPLTGESALSLDKTSSSAPTKAGDTIDYSLVVTNNGTTTISDLAVADTSFSGTGTAPTVSCPVDTLAPGEDTTCTASYTVTQDDVDAGVVTNTAVASGTDVNGSVDSDDSTATVTITPDPSLSLTKTPSVTDVDAAGQTVTYTFEVENTGNVSLSDFSIDDSDFSGDGTLGALSCSTIALGATLEPGDTTTCTADYTVTQADIDLGDPILNTATASGTPPNETTPVDSTPAKAEVDVTQTPKLSLTKTPSVTDVDAAGQTVTYTFEVENTGNVPLSDFSIDDSDFSGEGTLGALSCSTIALGATLEPGDTTTCTADYTVTQADIDLGDPILNTATASGTPPNQTTPVDSTPAKAEVDVTQTPELTLVKSVSPSDALTAGLAVTYSFKVTNSGNVTITDLAIDDGTAYVDESTPGFSGSGTLSSITCPVTTLLPGDETTCTATYTITQDDVDAGSVLNTATASGNDPDSQSVTSDPSKASIPADQEPAVGLVKSHVTPSDPAAAGDTVTFLFTVTNDGNVSLNGSTLSIADSMTGLSAVSCPASGEVWPHAPAMTLAPGDSVVCSATYTLTQDDVDAGEVVNPQAVATITPVGSSSLISSDPADDTVPLVGESALSLDKTSSSAPTKAGDIISYSLVVTNNGTTTISDLAVADTDFSGTGTAPTVSCPVTSLAPGDETTCTASYTVTQTDVDAGVVTNTAVATGTDVNGSVDSNDSTATVTITPNPELTLVKSVSPSDALTVGLAVTYSFEVTNSGNVTITDLAIDDGSAYVDESTPGFSGSGTLSAISCPVTTLLPGDETTCTATYTITQDDVDAGSVLNTATATGTDPDDQPVTSDPSKASIPADQEPAVGLVKSHETPTSPAAAGDTITFLFTVSNTGNVTLDGSTLSIADSMTGLSMVTCPASGEAWPHAPATTLAPGDSVVCSATYSVTQDDVDAGEAVNPQAVATITPVGSSSLISSDPADDTVPLTGESALSLDKTSSSAPTKAGDTIDYSLVVTNNGTTTVSDLAVADTDFSGTGTAPTVSCPVTSLAPGEETTCTASYTVTQDDVDAGVVTNTAVASGTDVNGPLDSNDSTATVTITPNPELTLVKSVSPSDALTAGLAVTYSFEVTNSGNVTITDLAIDDGAAYVDQSTPGFSGSGSLSAITCPVTTLAPNDTTTCTATYTITQDDVDAGSVLNTATASGNDPDSQPVTSAPSKASIPADQEPAVGLVKSHETPTSPATAGDTVTFLFTVSNTGNVTLDGSSLSFADSLNGLSAVTCPATGQVWPHAPATTLAPGDSVVCSATYAVTQDDIDAGQVVNEQAVVTATESGTTTTVDSDPASDTVPLTGESALSLDKTSSSTPTKAGDVISYSLVVTNNGTTTISHVVVADTAFSGSGTPPTVSCPATTLVPGDETTCTASYTVTQTDVDAGVVTNTAVATGTDVNGSVDSNDSTATVTITPNPVLTLTKTPSRTTVDAAGQTVTYTFQVQNTGNVSLSDFSIDDSDFSGDGTLGALSCSTIALGATLEPGDTTTCTAVYTVTQADIDLGDPILNTATASGTPPNQTTPVDSTPAEAEVDVTQNPELTLVKSVSPSDALTAGLSVTYSFAVTNSGNVTITDLAIDDGAAYVDQSTPGFSGSGSLSAITCPVTTLLPGDETTCTATYTITQDDVDAGTLRNTAEATGTDPGNSPVTSEPSKASIPADQEPAVGLVKSHVTPPDPAAAGDTVTFLFTVSNEGNVSLDGSTLTFADTMTGLSAVTCPATGEAWPHAPSMTLAPGDSVVCSATYALTQTDIDAGKAVNPQAVATITESGTTMSVDSPKASDTVPLTSADELTLVKDTTSTPAAAGDTIAYTFTVTNTGGTTVSGLSVAETSFSGSGATPLASCPVTTLAPGDSTECTATYTVTQTDVDAGQIDNTATASGSSVNGTVTSEPSSKTVTITPDPKLTLAKSAASSATLAVGGTVTYSFKVTNAGNVTITDLAIDDGGAYVDSSTPGFSGSGTLSAINCPATTLAPGDYTTCTATYVVTQTDMDTGVINNTATATGNDPSDQPVTSDPSVATVTPTRQPAVSLDKSHATPTNPAAAGDTVTFWLTVTNSGNVTLDGTTLSVADTMTGLSAVSCPGSGQAWPTTGSTDLAVGQSVVCSATYTLTQPDIDAGEVLNPQAIATITPVGSTTPINSPPASDRVPLQGSASLSLDKTTTSTPTQAGDTVNYSFLVTNTGTVSVSGLSIAEQSFNGSGSLPTPACPTMTLAPGDQTTCTVSYVLSQTDVDHGRVDNTAVANAVAAGTGDAVTSNDSSATVTITPAGALTLTKVGSRPGVSPNDPIAVGQTITYSFGVTNSGNVTVTDLAIDETAFSGASPISTATCVATELAPGASTTCTATYTVVQADIDAGATLTNTAEATGLDPATDLVTSNLATAEVPSEPTPSIDLTKTHTALTGMAQAGDPVSYQFTATNTGNVTLTGVTVTDDRGITVTCATWPGPVGELGPGEAVNCSATYVLTQTDVDAGVVNNQASVTGTTPTGVTPTTVQATATDRLTLPAAPALTVDKSSTTTAMSAPGTVVYTFDVTNTGNVTLDPVVVTDPGPVGGAGTMASVSCAQSSLLPGDTVRCTASYQVVQADIDTLDALVNTVTANGTAPDNQVVSAQDSYTVAVARTPALNLTKEVTPTSVDAPGPVAYEFVVSNTGNTTMSALTVTDPGPAGGTGTMSAVTCTDSVLAPGAATTCTATYQVTQADVNAGLSLVNTAVVSGVDPLNPRSTATSQPAEATVGIHQAPGLTLVKTVSPSGAFSVGQPLTYTFTVTNSGDVTVSALSIDETAFSGSGTMGAISCALTVLDPGAVTTCTAQYSPTQTDFDQSVITNTAAAQGLAPNGTTTIRSLTDTATVTAVPTPSIALTKTANTDQLVAGQTVTYSFAVTNNGDVTLHGISIDETAFTGSGTVGAITCDRTTLVPNEVATCTADYVVTQTDVDAMSVVNTAEASGTAPTVGSVPGATVTSPPSTVTLTTQDTPKLTLVKTVTPNTTSALTVGQVLTYHFAVTNSGPLTVDYLTVTDTNFSGSGTLSAITCPATSLAPGTSTTCSATYSVTQTDVNANVINNEATASGQTLTGTPVESTPSSATVTGTPHPAIGLTKTHPAGAVGSTVSFTLTATNTGNVTLTGVTVTDALVSNVVCPTWPSTSGVLDPGQSVVCQADYTVVQADYDAGSITNHANVVGTPPTGADVTNQATDTLNLPPLRALTLSKVADLSVVDTAGTVVTFTYTVTNTGTQPLHSLTVTDPGPVGGTGVMSLVTLQTLTLAPGESTTGTATYVVTQADIDANLQMVTTAVANGIAPDGSTIVVSNKASVVVTVVQPHVNTGGTVETNSGAGLLVLTGLVLTAAACLAGRQAWQRRSI